MKNKKISLVICCVAFLVVLSVIGSSYEDVEWYEWLWGGELSGTHGNPVLNWYEISQWEVDVCFDWGGTDDPNEYSQNNVMGEDYYHNLMITLQAEVSDALGEEDLSGGTKVYEVAWFIQPTDLDESINFEIYIRNDHGTRELIESTSSNYVNGFRGYDVRESSSNYSEAVIYYWNDKRTKDELVVPFVE